MGGNANDDQGTYRAAHLERTFGKKKKPADGAGAATAIAARNDANVASIVSEPYVAAEEEEAQSVTAPTISMAMEEEEAQSVTAPQYAQYEASKYLEPQYAAYEPNKYLSAEADHDDADGNVATTPALALAPPVAHDHDPFNQGAGPLVTTPLLDEYHGEHEGQETSTHLPTQIGGLATTRTKYAARADEHRASIVEGKLTTAGGKTADTAAAKRMWGKDKDDRFNFAMDGHGSTYLSDPKAEFGAGHRAAKAAGETETTRINHSTMVAGGDVAGAGSVKLRDGKVETLGDGSGHYQPAVTQTAQVAATMAQQGVLDPARASIELSDKGGNGELVLSAQELLSYGEGKDNKFAAAKQSYQASGNKEDLGRPEDEIRTRHAKKDAMLAQLKGSVPRVKRHQPQPVYADASDLIGGDAPELAGPTYADASDLIGGDEPEVAPAPAASPTYADADELIGGPTYAASPTYVEPISGAEPYDPKLYSVVEAARKRKA